ncbi:MAG: hypothetical protein VB064_07765 [Oscillospiraceae bacterium]|nr:hypothetical protein [Oscillospiraceae bacterium]
MLRNQIYIGDMVQGKRQNFQDKKAAQEKALRDATNRISFIQDASKRLFEEKITGNVPDSLF